MTKFINVNFEVSSENALQYSAAKDYVFKCEIDVEVGDLVVCETARGYGVAKVVGEETRESKRKVATAWIISKLDLTEHTARLEREKQRAELKMKMNELKKKLEDEAVFALLAKDNPEMAQLFEAFQALK